MATYGQTLRRGLPRVAGGVKWPAEGEAPADAVAPAGAGAGAGVEADGVPVEADAAASAVAASAPQAHSDSGAAADNATVIADAGGAPAGVAAADGEAGQTLRRGLPRVPGGEPWPPASAVGASIPGRDADADAGPAAGVAAAAAGSAPPVPPLPAQSAADAAAASAPTQSAGAEASDGSTEGTALRRGLPRVAGGEPWPPADARATAPRSIDAAVAPAAAPQAPAAAAGTATQAPTAAQAPLAAQAPATTAAATDVVRADAASVSSDVETRVAEPLSFTPTVWEGRYARTRPAPKPEPERLGPFTKVQWAGAAIVAGAGLLFAAAMGVLAVRWLLSIDPLASFVETYPGEYHLPEGAPVGLPAWLGWQHFFNVFLIVLIIRSGWQVRTQKRPSAFWSPRHNKRRKISLNLWFHQSLDILWVANGLVFVVLLFVTGQWMRIVPTSWEVFPNAISAALQYASLDWPTENGWVNYNSLQQLAYFATVFIAAPLAVITGVRMSGIWPKNAKTLSRLYPVEWARAVHFPVMLYFVFFIFVHVVLVFATGALRNLNHMYAAQGSVDPDAYAMNWTGFWIFAASMLVIVAAWAAARPLILAPIARLFGTVASR